jgi:Na+/H+ antiporter NhaC
MRPVTDRLRISREKLAYIVDSTAAPVACLAFVTTWIGYEVGIIGAAVRQIADFNESAYSIFLHSVPYSFYPWLAIFFVLATAWTQRDVGPMHRAEWRSRQTGEVTGGGANVPAAADGDELKPVEGRPHRPINAIAPIIVLVAGVVTGLFLTGEGSSLREIVGSADSYAALMWASLAGVLVAAALSVGQRVLTVEQTIDAWYAGLKSMLFAIIILVLAWALSDVTAALHTAPWLVSVLGEALPAAIVPALIFVLSAATAFATGSSWGTMGILMPLVVPLVWAVLVSNGAADPAHYHILYSTVACVLAGAVWGDHCSPISDTTILSSLASGSDHIEHVRTQMPDALTVGVVGVTLGTVPAGFGVPWWVGLLVSGGVLVLWLRVFGRRADEPPTSGRD